MAKRWHNWNFTEYRYERPEHIIFHASNKEKFSPNITDIDLLLSGWFEEEYDPITKQTLPFDFEEWKKRTAHL